MICDCFIVGITNIINSVLKSAVKIYESIFQKKQSNNRF